MESAPTELERDLILVSFHFLLLLKIEFHYFKKKMNKELEEKIRKLQREISEREKQNKSSLF
jgi:F0F1-type ATP synthase membrane subunit b/b'